MTEGPNLVQLQAMAREIATLFANLAGPAGGAHAHVAETQSMVQAVLGGLDEAERRLLQLKGAGFAVTRMDSTLILLRETRDKGKALAGTLAGAAKEAEAQRARLASLLAGVEAMIG